MYCGGSASVSYSSVGVAGPGDTIRRFFFQLPTTLLGGVSGNMPKKNGLCALLAWR